MSKRANRWKLGLFVILSLGAMAGLGIWLGVIGLSEDRTTLVTYFEGTVGDLTVGSDVLYHGVSVGSVEAVDIAPDGRRIAVEVAVEQERLRALGLPRSAPMPPALRLSLSSAGLTGGREVELAFVDPQAHPPPELPFDPPPSYVPSYVTGVASLPEAASEIAAQVQATLGDVQETVRGIQAKVEALEVAPLVERVERVVGQVETKLAALDVAAIQSEVVAASAETRRTAASLRALAEDEGELTRALEGARAVAERVETELGEARLGETSRAVREGGQAVEATAERLDALTGELEVMLRTLDETLEAVRALAERLEREPGSLLRGRGQGDGR